MNTKDSKGTKVTKDPWKQNVFVPFVIFGSLRVYGESLSQEATTGSMKD
jgi:hypothetical protein